MGMLVLLLICLACGCHGQRIVNERIVKETLDGQGFISAVENSYDVNESFSENIHSILGIICPNSIFCSDNVTTELDNNVFWSTMNDTASIFTKLSPNYQPRLISEARAILQNNAHKLKVCCTPCSCENSCVERKNCYPEIRQIFQKSDDVEQDGVVTQKCVYASIQSYFPKPTFTKADTAELWYFMVTDCFSFNASEASATKCKHPNLTIPVETTPVYSATTERIYKNRFCGECNNDNQVTPWIPVIAFKDKFSFTGQIKLPSTPEDMYMHVSNGRSRNFLSLLYMPPANMPLATKNFGCWVSNSGSFDHLCRERDDQTSFITHACAANSITYHTPKHTFNNVFCFLECITDSLDVDKEESDSTNRNLWTSFSAIFSLNQLESTGIPTGTDTIETGTPCRCREYFDELKKLCRMLMCPPGEIFKLCACVEFLQNITGMNTKIYLEITPELQESPTKQTAGRQLDETFETKLMVKLKRVIDSQWKSAKSTDSLLFRETSTSDLRGVKYHTVILVHLRGAVDIKEVVKNMFSTFQASILIQLLGIPVKVSLGRIFNEKAGIVNDSDAVIEQIGQTNIHTFKYSQTISKIVYCKRVQLEEGEIELLRNKSLNIGLSQTYLDYVFQEEDGSMCLDDFHRAFLPEVSGATSFCYTNMASAWCVMWVIHAMCMHIIIAEHLE